MKKLAMAVGMFALIALAGCGGGEHEAKPALLVAGTSGFQGTNFSGKSIYIVDGSSYQQVIFDASGATRGSLAVTAGAPTVNTQPDIWSIANGALVMTNGSSVTQFVLLTEDSANRYYKVTRTGATGVSATVGMFYDQSTGLTQAQAFVAAGTKP